MAKELQQVVILSLDWQADNSEQPLDSLVLVPNWGLQDMLPVMQAWVSFLNTLPSSHILSSNSF